MKFEKKYIIEKWIEWNTILSNAIGDFNTVYSLAPNILEANNHTYSQIDFLTNVVPGEKDKLYRTDELTERILKPQPNENVGVSGFNSAACSLGFAIDNNLNDRKFRLVYDSDPEWNDETGCPNPIETDEKKQKCSIF